MPYFHTALSSRVFSTSLQVTITEMFVCGLALDFCVAYSAVDASIAGFDTYVIMNATKPVDLPGSVEATYEAFNKHNITKVEL